MADPEFISSIQKSYSNVLHKIQIIDSIESKSKIKVNEDASTATLALKKVRLANQKKAFEDTATQFGFSLTSNGYTPPANVEQPVTMPPSAVTSSVNESQTENELKKIFSNLPPIPNIEELLPGNLSSQYKKLDKIPGVSEEDRECAKAKLLDNFSVEFLNFLAIKNTLALKKDKSIKNSALLDSMSEEYLQAIESMWNAICPFPPKLELGNFKSTSLGIMTNYIHRSQYNVPHSGITFQQLKDKVQECALTHNSIEVNTCESLGLKSYQVKIPDKYSSLPPEEAMKQQLIECDNLMAKIENMGTAEPQQSKPEKLSKKLKKKRRAKNKANKVISTPITTQVQPPKKVPIKDPLRDFDTSSICIPKEINLDIDSFDPAYRSAHPRRKGPLSMSNRESIIIGGLDHKDDDSDDFE